MFPAFAGYGMQPLSGVEYGGMLSDLVHVPFAMAMLHPVAEDVADVACASASDNVLDGYRAVAPHLARHPRSEVLVIGHGYPSIPLYAVQAALALGASNVDFVGSDPRQVAMAEALGAHACSSRFESAHKRYPIVVEAGALLTAVRYAIASTEPEGVCQSLSFFPGRDVALPLADMYTHGIRYCIGRAHSSALLPEVLGLLEMRQLRPERVTTRIVSWREAPAAFLEPTQKLVVRMHD
jgi:alcohol dehydrogenase